HTTYSHHIPIAYVYCSQGIPQKIDRQAVVAESARLTDGLSNVSVSVWMWSLVLNQHDSF
ncbi:hypothetical protein, partial [Vibrio anguillarum]|uniref:hypothetical protein n=1 Tax=Vibrio anguillarum TaxID=55601 RepID=UPI001BE3F16D